MICDCGVVSAKVKNYIEYLEDCVLCNHMYMIGSEWWYDDTDHNFYIDIDSRGFEITTYKAIRRIIELQHASWRGFYVR